jgi:Flp pilus assembly protein TadD
MDDPLSLIINARVGFVLVMARRFNDAIAAERRTLQLDSTFAPAYWSLGDAYTGMRKFDDAASEFAKARANSGLLLGDIGYSYAAAGDTRSARDYLAAMDLRSRTAYVDPYDRALVYAGLGERDAAMRWLEVGRQQHSASIIWLRVEPMFDGLRSDPRFDTLVKAVGL